MAMERCPRCKGVFNFVLRGRVLRLQSDGDVTVLVSNQRRTETYDGEFTMEERNPKITATVVVPLDQYVGTDLEELCDVAVVLELCDGRVFSSEHASNVSDNPYDAKRNLQPLELICDSIVEMLPAATGTTTAIGGAGAF